MAFRFPFRFRRRNKIRRLNRSPHNSIKRWLKEKKKTVTIDPIKRRKKTTKDKKIDVERLRTVITQIVLKVNELVEHVQERPEELEKMILWEIDTREKEIILLTAKHDKEMLDLEEKLTRMIRYNRRLIIANSALDYQDRKNLVTNTIADVELRSRFETHRNATTVGLFPLTHYPGAPFEEGGSTLDTPIRGKRYKPKTNHNKGVITKPKPLTKSQRMTIDNEIIPIEFGGANPGNVLQDFTFDQDGRIYVTHDPGGGDTCGENYTTVISKLSPTGELCPVEGWCEEGLGSYDGIITPDCGWQGFGHGQGITYEEIPGPTVDMLWATTFNCFDCDGKTSYDTATAYRFSREYMQYENAEEFKLFDSNEYEKLMVSLSPSQKYLVASAKHISGTYHIKIFNKPNGEWNTHETDDDGVWVSDHFVIEAPTSFQGIAISNRRVYCQFGNSEINSDKHLYIYDFNGEVLEHRVHTIGKDWALEIDGIYEPEGLAFKGNRLYIGIVRGESGERDKALFPVDIKIRPKQQQNQIK